ncbi:30S ribosomal protein S9 [Candidatus Dependentiae bacterium]|nr:30S ribosomal protein S9 [Candidatus Dependentiae bacterium]
MAETQYYSTGRRKTSTARVFLRPGNGKILINKKELTDYFNTLATLNTVREPLLVTKTNKKFNLFVTVKGGGISGQAGAVAHGISRALTKVNEEYRNVLKKKGFLKRDPRMKERKKYGQRGARARFQFSKR